MEEASSIIKAIEKAWNRAGSPKEFSVKIFEEPQKNFIGLTVKPAKIALLFTDEKMATIKEASPVSAPFKAKQVQKASPKPEIKVTTSGSAKIKPLVNQEIKNIKEKQVNLVNPENKQEKDKEREIWPKNLIDTVSENLHDVLRILNLEHIKYVIKDDNFHLRINFEKPLFSDKAKEHSFFVSLSTLLLQVLKYKNKRPFKGYKIVLLS